MRPAQHILDANLALERAGGNHDLARELYGMLQRELPVYTTRLRNAFEARDFSTLQEVVHKLNGSATYCGVPALKEAAATLESTLKRGETDNCGEWLEQVLQQIGHVQQLPELSF